MRISSIMWLIIILIYIPAVSSDKNQHTLWFKTISKFQDKYPPSNIFIAQSEAFDDLQISYALVSMLRQFSEENVSAIIARITDIPRQIHYCRQSKHRHLFVVILKSIVDLVTFSEITKSNNLNQYRILILFTGNTSEFCHNPVGNQFNLNFDSKMLVKCEDSFVIQEWYSIHTSTTKVANLFVWNSNFDRFVELTRLGFYERRNSLNGLELRVVTKNYYDYTGIFAEVLGVISEAANFKVKIQPFEKKAEVFDHVTKERSGIIGQIEANQADVGFTALGLTMTTNRLEIVEFSKVLTIIKSKFYIGKLSKACSMPSMYYKVIGIKATYCLLALLTGSPIILTVIIVKKKQISYGRILYDNYLYVWRTFCMNSSPAPSLNLSTKVACLSLLFTAYVLHSVYSTLLVSYLTVFKPDLPFHTLEEFIDAKTHKIAIFKNNSLIRALEVSNDTILKQLRPFFVDFSNISFAKMAKKVCNSGKKLGLFSHDIRFKSSQIDFPCELIPFGNELVLNKVLVFTKDTPYKGLFDHYVQRMQDSGVLRALVNRYFKNRKSVTTGYKSVNLQNTLPILGILGVGISLSLFIFICEKCLKLIEKISSKSTTERF